MKFLEQDPNSLFAHARWRLSKIAWRRSERGGIPACSRFSTQARLAHSHTVVLTLAVVLTGSTQKSETKATVTEIQDSSRRRLSNQDIPTGEVFLFTRRHAVSRRTNGTNTTTTTTKQPIVHTLRLSM